MYAGIFVPSPPRDPREPIGSENPELPCWGRSLSSSGAKLLYSFWSLAKRESSCAPVAAPAKRVVNDWVIRMRKLLWLWLYTIVKFLSVVKLIELTTANFILEGLEWLCSQFKLRCKTGYHSWFWSLSYTFSQYCSFSFETGNGQHFICGLIMGNSILLWAIKCIKNEWLSD